MIVTQNYFREFRNLKFRKIEFYFCAVKCVTRVSIGKYMWCLWPDGVHGNFEVIWCTCNFPGNTIFTMLGFLHWWVFSIKVFIAVFYDSQHKRYLEFPRLKFEKKIKESFKFNIIINGEIEILEMAKQNESEWKSWLCLFDATGGDIWWLRWTKACQVSVVVVNQQKVTIAKGWWFE